MNKVGGIERTNLRFRFWAHSDKVFARPEAHYERLERWRKEAPEEVRKSSTNYVVGFSAITRIDVSGDYTSYYPESWRATAKVEFVNAGGGTETTNLPFKFSTHSDNIFAETGLWDEELASIQTEAKQRMDVLDKAHEEALQRLSAGTLAGPRTWTFRKGAKLLGSFVRFEGTNAVVISRASDGQEVIVKTCLLLRLRQRVHRSHARQSDCPVGGHAHAGGRVMERQRRESRGKVWLDPGQRKPGPSLFTVTTGPWKKSQPRPGNCPLFRSRVWWRGRSRRWGRRRRRG